MEKFNDNKLPKDGDKVVYVDGSFDMFHAGHAEYLKQAKELGDFLIVGIQGDDLVRQIESTYPILNQEERALSVLACRVILISNHSTRMLSFSIHLIN